MSFQYFETLLDKSKERILYFCKQIEPKFTVEELQILLSEIAKKPVKNKNGSKFEGIKNFINIYGDKNTPADLSNLEFDELKVLYQFFISKEINNKVAVKWRFYQNLKFIPELKIETIQINQGSTKTQLIDFILENTDGKFIFVLCYDTLDSDNYYSSIEILNKFAKINKITPDLVYFVAYKCYRDIKIDTPFDITNQEIIPNLWVEWIEEKCPFNGEDLLIINNNEANIAGFNFTSLQDLLNYAYKFSNKGQISIFKRSGFFSELIEDEQQIELMWKGIMT